MLHKRQLGIELKSVVWLNTIDCKGGLRFPTVNASGRDSEIAPTVEVQTYFDNSL